MSKKKVIIILIITLIIFLSVTSIIIYKKNTQKETVQNNPQTQTKTTQTTPRKQATPLTIQEKEIIQNVIESSEVIPKIPEKYPIALSFFYFEDKKRYWQDTIKINNQGIIKSGTTYITLTLHNDYIKEFENKDFCTVIKEAKANDDLGYDTKESTASLMWKYKKLLPYKDCFGLEI